MRWAAISGNVQVNLRRAKAMKRSANLLSAVFLLVAAVAPAVTMAASAEAPVFGQELMKVRESSRVQAASWTRRPDAYTLQLVFQPKSLAGGRTLNLVDGRRIAPGYEASASQPQQTMQSEVSVWLLRADGTQILPRTPPWTKPENCWIPVCNAIEILYRFSLDASQAMAVAVRIGDEFYIEKLQPLEQAQ